MRLAGRVGYANEPAIEYAVSLRESYVPCPEWYVSCPAYLLEAWLHTNSELRRGQQGAHDIACQHELDETTSKEIHNLLAASHARRTTRTHPHVISTGISHATCIYIYTGLLPSQHQQPVMPSPFSLRTPPASPQETQHISGGVYLTGRGLHGSCRGGRTSERMGLISRSYRGSCAGSPPCEIRAYGIYVCARRVLQGGVSVVYRQPSL